METSNKELTAERSLEIIAQTIEKSRRRIVRGSWKSMMLWGVSVAVVALVVGHLWAHTSLGPVANGLWGIMGIISVGERWYQKRQPKVPESFVSKSISQVWACLGIMAGSVGFILGMLSCFQISIPLPVVYPLGSSGVTYFPITALMILLMGIAGMITGRMLRSTVITVCCYIGGILGSFLALVYVGPYEMLVLAGVAIVGLVVPALIIKTKEE